LLLSVADQLGRQDGRQIRSGRDTRPMILMRVKRGQNEVLKKFEEREDPTKNNKRGGILTFFTVLKPKEKKSAHSYHHCEFYKRPNYLSLRIITVVS
jgi:hypothetical protein